MRVFTFLAIGFLASGQPAEWVNRSNQNAKVLLDAEAQFSPEAISSIGVEGLDEKIFDLNPRLPERSRAAIRRAIEELERRLAAEKDPLVRQDLEILIDSGRKDIRASETRQKLLIPYIDVTRAVFTGLRGLLDDQVSAERRRAALVRLRRYAGLEEGYTPVTILARERTLEAMKSPELLGPPRSQVERDLANGSALLEGIPQLFAKYQIVGFEPAFAKLKDQLAEYQSFIKSEVLPRSRTDFRLPPELYAINLDQVGVDLPPAELVRIAQAAFLEIQREMEVLAKKVAAERKLSASGYRDVIRELKKKQLIGDDILTHYLERLEQIEAIIRRERLVTLPARAARIRLATPAESAASPAPNMRPPRLIGNRGERGEFVLPLTGPASSGEVQKLDDFTFEAASWTLTAHETRPGHELQFAAMVEMGVSTARAVYAFNSTNVEGWGLYSEAILKPHMPAEGQLISLQHRLLRAARAFLDPELQLGKTPPAEAMRVLKDDVVLSDAMATQEVERYTFRSPGQATSYFYGYTKLMELRRDVEKAMGRRFNAQRFHDYVLAQGLLPPVMLRKAVMEGFAKK